MKVSAQDMATLIGVGKSQVNRLTSDGLLVKVERGQYDAVQSIANLVQHYRDTSGGEEMATVRMELMREQRWKLKLENDQTEDDLVPVLLLGEALTDLVHMLGTKLDSLLPNIK